MGTLIVAALLLAGSVFFLIWGWIAVAPAAAYKAGTVCAANAPVGAECRTVGTDTVARIVRGADHFGQVTLLLEGHGRVPGGTVHGSLTGSGTKAPQPGDSMHVVAWRGGIVNASGGRFSGAGVADPVHDLGLVCIAAVLFLVAGLGVMQLSLRSGTHGPRRRLRHARRNSLITLVAAIIMVLIRQPWPAVAAVTLAAAWIVAWCTAAGRSVVADFAARVRAVEASRPAPKDFSEVRAEMRAAWREARGRTDGCPVTESQQAWIETSMLWFTAQFGYDPVRRPTVLPTHEFFPADYTGADRDIRTLVRVICPMMGIAPERISVRLVGESSSDPEAYRYVVHRESYAAGTFGQTQDGAFVVKLDRAMAADQARMTAVIAHELGHARLIGEERVDRARADQEPLTDLITVYFGLGIFNANAARIATPMASGFAVDRLGYLDQRMFGYALACYARLRHEPAPRWERYLTAPIREYLDQGTAYLRKAAPYGGFPAEKAA